MIEFNAPVRFADGRMGIIIRIEETRVGVQIPNAENILWFFKDFIVDVGGGALVCTQPSGILDLGA